jgi:UPF0042 nucleotide-binding protein
MNDPTKAGLIIIVTGLSGSGKTSALKILEDNGFMAIDNLPVLLLPKLLAVRKESRGDFIRLAIGMDGRDPDLVAEHGKAFEEAREMGYDLRLLFLEADDEALVKRYSETRRSHPFSQAAGNLIAAIRRERQELKPLKEVAALVLDTSSIRAAELRDIVVRRFVSAGGHSHLSVEVLSFGFKNGLPPEADLMFDVRVLPNPFYIDKLRSLDGRDEEVRGYVLSFPETQEFLKRLLDILQFLLPLYQREGKSYLTIAVGCTGGQHRSVALAVHIWEELGRYFKGPLVLRHRDIS